MEELVSVIIPIYNGELTIKRTVKSVLNQSYSNIEVIIIDDCSTDNSYNIIENIAQNDKRIKLYHNEINLGVSKTRNIGINFASGEFIAFLDSDDVWKKDKLKRQLCYMNKTQIDICYTGYEIIGESDGESIIYKVPKYIDYAGLLKENIICCSSVVIKSDLLRENHFNDEFFHEDFVLWLQLLKLGIKASGIQESLVIYRKGGRSANKIKAAKNRWIIYRKSERLTFLQSMYYFLCYTINGIKKYY